MQLRGYQQAVSKDVGEAWADGAVNVMGVMPTGSGKTVLFTNEMAANDGASIAIAHRKELVGQMSVALARWGLQHRIIAPDATIAQIVGLHSYYLGKNFHHPAAPIAVAGVDTLARRDLGGFEKQVSLWVQDECFVGATLVDGRPIKTIKVGDIVTAFDERTGRFTRRKVTRTFRSPAPSQMVRAITQAGQVLHCTPGHPFWTQRGWVIAIDLRATDKVLQYELHKLRGSDHWDERSTALSLPENGSHLLQEGVRDGAPRIAPDPGLDSAAPCVAAPDGYPVPGMQEAGGSDWLAPGVFQKDGPGILRPSVQRQAARRSFVSDHGAHEQSPCLGPDVAKQSNGQAGNPHEGVGQFASDRPCAESAGRQRARTPETGTNVDGPILASGIHQQPRYPNRSETRELSTPSTMLQAGCGASRIETGPRSGWSQPFRGAKGAGCEEGYLSRWVGLDSIAVYQRGNHDPARECGDDGHVYNLEVDELHTYVANGLVVHNCHHLLRDNKWGKVIERFPNARGLGVTGSPTRADRKGLGRHADGVMDRMILGPSMRELIDAGFLCDYRLFAPTSDLDVSAVPISEATGDFNPDALRKAAEKSHIVGDVVDSYRKFAPGALGVTFAVSVEIAERTAQKFRDAGIPAQCVSADTPDLARAHILKRFANREILQLVNVDLFGEGFDLPAIEVVSMARPTESLAVYLQQFGRALRPLDGKDKAIIIDHVGNWHRHQLPDVHREWSLDRGTKRERRKKDEEDLIPIRVCAGCTGVYERALAACPYCGQQHKPIARTSPQHVDGDLTELDPQVLRNLRRQIETADGMPAIPYGVSHEVAGAIRKRHRHQQMAQAALRELIAWYGGYQRALGRDDAEGYRRFYLEFGTDVLTAQTFNQADALALAGRLRNSLTAVGLLPENQAA